MLGQPIYMLMPEVVGFKLTGRAARGRDRDRPGAHASRRCCASTASSASSSSSSARASTTMSVADRATIANMAPEYGATIGFFPVDDRDAPLPATHRARRRSTSTSSSATARSRASGASRAGEPSLSEVLELDLGTVEPALAGPKRPQDRVALAAMKSAGGRISRRAFGKTSATAIVDARVRRERGHAADGRAEGLRLDARRARREDVHAPPRRGRDRRDHQSARTPATRR